MSTSASSPEPTLPESRTPFLPTIVDWKETAVHDPYKTCGLHELIEEQAKKTPDQVALVFEDQRLTYAELLRRADLLAVRLRALGAGRDLLVGLFVERSLDMIVGLLGILKSGAAYLPIDTNFPSNRVAFLLSDAKVIGLLTQSHLLPGLQDCAVPAICLDQFDWNAADTVGTPQTAFSSEQLAYVIYTSGTTGPPKGVGIEHRNIVNYTLGIRDRLNLAAGMNHAFVSTIAADLGNTVIFPSLATGGCLHIISKDRAENQGLLAEYFERERIDVLKIVPSHLSALLAGENPAGVIPRQRLILGGEASRFDLIEQVKGLSQGTRIFNHYGPTETTVGVLMHEVGAENQGNGSGTVPIGKPLPNIRAYILDAVGLQVPEGTTGELYIGGAGVARGYLNRPELNADKFFEDRFHNEPGGRLYRTGDLARYLPDGSIQFCGRTDSQVKIHGYRVEPGEIEAALRSQAGVQDALVVALDDAEDNARLVAYIVAARASQPLWDFEKRFVLPDGLTVAHLNKNETTYIHEEIFVLQAYLRHGITIHDGDCIVDAGSNIGLFTVFANRIAQGLRIFCFEPNPAAFACLKANAAAWGSNAQCLQMGLSSENKFAELTAFKEFSLLSGFHVDPQKEREVVETYALNRGSESVADAELNAGIGELLENRFQTTAQTVEMKTLSTIIAEKGIGCIDLLKVNVEKSELELLGGIADSDWPKIRQLVVEVDQQSSLPAITMLLEQKGYEVLAEQDPLLRNTELCYIYAIRPSSDGNRLVREQAAHAHIRKLLPFSEEVLTPERLRGNLAKSLPQYMIPAAFVLLDKFPLTVNGKLDRKALPVPSTEKGLWHRDSLRPRSKTEQALAAIWSEVLKVRNPGVNDDFFDLGGHSLLAIKIASRIRDVLELNISIQAIFEHSTLVDLARHVEQMKDAKHGAEHIERRNIVGPSLLSYSQQQLWYLYQFAPNSPVYNIVTFVGLEGSYNADAMWAALDEMVRRHESLRTIFFYSNGKPMQSVLPGIDLAFEEIDLSSLGDKDRDSGWKRAVNEISRKPFNLSQAPLFRLAIVHLNSSEHRLILVIHHIVADEWSIEIFHREIGELYNAFSRHRKPSLPELPIQYADFAAWSREWMRGEALEGEIAYWKHELAGAPLVLELPADKPRPAAQSFRGATEVFDLPAGLADQLKEIAYEQHATLFMILAAGFMALLHRYTGQDDVLMGTPVSSRTHRETENLIGYFLNPAVLRAQFNERTTFRSLLQQIRERALRTFAHPDMPFDRLVAELAPERDASQTPLFQTMFVLHNPEGGPGIAQNFVNQDLQTGTSKFDLTLAVAEFSEGLRGMFEYSTDLFDPETIRRMCGHLSTLLETFARNPDQKISRAGMLTSGESSEMLVAWNNTAVARPNSSHSLHHLFELQAERTPERIALVFDRTEMSYRVLNGRANQLAAHLKKLGVGPDALVGLMVERSLDMMVGLLGILKAGGAYVPLDPSFPENRLSYMVEDSKMNVLVTHRGLDEHLTHRPSTIVRLDSDWPQITREEGSSSDQTASSGKNLAYILYTSGSTGKPKGVAIPHAAIVNFLLSMQKTPGFRQDDVLLAVTTLSFDIAGLELYLPLTMGGKSVIASHEETHDPARLQERIRESRCTVMQATPATWRALIQSGWNGSATLKILCGGEALPRELADELLPRCKELWNMYGPTETTVWSAAQKIEAGDRSVSIGRPIDNTQFYILDKNRNLVPRGVAGELYIGGDGLARGYLHRDDLTRDRFVPNPFVAGALMYCTGDLARWLPDGTVECLGRSDNQAKLRGFRIELGEIEAIMDGHDAIKHCVVVVREDVPGDKKLVVYFEAKEGSSPSPRDLRAYMEEDLPSYMIPSIFVSLAKLPLTPNGKIDRKALPAPADIAEAGGPTSGSVAPRDPLEKMLSQIWEKALNATSVGIHDNFFDLGGHSLLAVRIVVEVEKATGTRLPIATLLQAPTVAGLAEILRRKNWSPTWSSLIPIRPEGSKPPLFLFHSHGGNVMEYYELANELERDQPVYALQAQGLDGKIPRRASLEEMAATYLKEVRSFQPEGPYYLGGFCFGGVVALEAAHQLIAAGEKVAALLMIQSMHPVAARFKTEVTVFERLWHLTARRISLETENISQRGWNYFADQCRHILGRGRARVAILRDRAINRSRENLTGKPMYYILETLGMEHLASYRKYSPRPYHGTAVLFRTSKQLRGQNSDELLGWKKILVGPTEVIEIPGHQQNILVAPNVKRLGLEIGSLLVAAHETHQAAALLTPNDDSASACRAFQIFTIASTIPNP